jgi:hypothetical protein
MSNHNFQRKDAEAQRKAKPEKVMNAIPFAPLP